MSCEFNGILPAASERQFERGQCVLTPLWVAGCNKYGQSGWQGEIVVGTVIDVQDEYDPAPDAEVAIWQTLTVEATVPGKAEPSRFTRSSCGAILLPRAE